MLVHERVQAIFEIFENFNPTQAYSTDIGNYHYILIEPLRLVEAGDS